MAEISIIDRFDYLVEHGRCPRCGDGLLKKSRFYCPECAMWVKKFILDGKLLEMVNDNFVNNLFKRRTGTHKKKQ